MSRKSRKAAQGITHFPGWDDNHEVAPGRRTVGLDLKCARCAAWLGTIDRLTSPAHDGGEPAFRYRAQVEFYGPEGTLTMCFACTCGAQPMVRADKLIAEVNAMHATSEPNSRRVEDKRI